MSTIYSDSHYDNVLPSVNTFVSRAYHSCALPFCHNKFGSLTDCRPAAILRGWVYIDGGELIYNIPSGSNSTQGGATNDVDGGKQNNEICKSIALTLCAIADLRS